MTTNLSPQLSRALFRSLLRASRFGRHPEVFSYTSRQSVKNIDNDRQKDKQQAAPSTPLAVRKALRESFSLGKDNTVIPQDDPFVVLKHAYKRSSILLPDTNSLPQRIPIFDYMSAAILPGEETLFNFFEPRYKIMANDDNNEYDSYFLLRAGKPPRGGSTLVKIEEKSILPNGNVAVRCRAGPRVNVQGCDYLKVIDKSFAGECEPLTIATEYRLVHDDDSVGFWLVDDPDLIGNEQSNVEAYNIELQKKRERILELLSCLSPAADDTNYFHVILVHSGYPPLDPELFSFWALHFVLAPGDIASRIRWLYRCHDSDRRMDYVLNYLEMQQDLKKI